MLGLEYLWPSAGTLGTVTFEGIWPRDIQGISGNLWTQALSSSVAIQAEALYAHVPRATVFILMPYWSSIQCLEAVGFRTLLCRVNQAVSPGKQEKLLPA